MVHCRSTHYSQQKSMCSITQLNSVLVAIQYVLIKCFLGLTTYYSRLWRMHTKCEKKNNPKFKNPHIHLLWETRNIYLNETIKNSKKQYQTETNWEERKCKIILFKDSQTVLPETPGLCGNASGVPERLMYTVPNTEDLNDVRRFTVNFCNSKKVTNN